MAEKPSKFRFRFSLRTLLLLVLFLAGGAAFLVQALRDPLHGMQGAQEFRDWILKKTPVGMGYDDVLATVKKAGWYDANRTSGIPADHGKAIRGELGAQHRTNGDVEIDAVWFFDANDRLQDVWIQELQK